MIHYRAAWVLPIVSPPLHDAWLAVDHGRVVAYGRHRFGDRLAGGTRPAAGTEEVDLGDVALMPGLVNAHTHLELSWMRGAIPTADHFVDWVKALVRIRATEADDQDRVRTAMAAAIAEVRASGTCLVGDIGNSLVSFDALAASPLSAVVFFELLKLAVDDAPALVRDARARIDALPFYPRLRAALAAHAPYSVAPLLFRAIKQDLDRHPFARVSVHLGEACEEIELMRTGQGPWRSLWIAAGGWDPRWVAPGCGPAEFLERAGFLDPRVIAVHGVRLTAAELECLARHRVTLVTCPRSNLHTGAGQPPVEAFYAAGVPVAVGTDSLASNTDLNLFAELALLRRLAPGVRASALLQSATVTGARALGFEAEVGSLETGRRAEIIAVEVPRGETSVEEYLVNGIAPEQVHWVVEPGPGARAALSLIPDP